MKGFKTNIDKATVENNNFREVLYTSKHSQLVLMSLKPKKRLEQKFILTMTSFFELKPDMGYAS
jgi:hypothetical protein